MALYPIYCRGRRRVSNGGPYEKTWQEVPSNLIFSLVMLVVCGLLCLIPEAFTNPSSNIPRERVRIESVDNTQLYPLGIVYSGSQNCEVTVLTGEYAGESTVAHNYQNSALDKDKLFEAATRPTAWCRWARTASP